MRVLALEPYYGGSHQAILDGWVAHSRHSWTVLTLPAYKWKWRMRQSAVTFAWEVEERLEDGERWDALLCSAMLNLAEFRGLTPALHHLPATIYFHENQLTYPVRHEQERDYQFGFTNILSALAAESVWFISEFNRDSFLEAIPRFLNKMPDYRPLDSVRRIAAKSSIQPPGIAPPAERAGERPPGPLHLLWVARWEFDKAPEVFFEALDTLVEDGVAFRVSVLGQGFREAPEVFDRARVRLGERVVHWGYLPDAADYRRALAEADVVVSTAIHEFFGLSVAEALAAGCYPLLPRRLAYPELLGGSDGELDEHFYDGSARELARRLRRLGERLEDGDLWGGDRNRCRRRVERLLWSRRAAELDAALAGSGVESGEPAE